MPSTRTRRPQPEIAKKITQAKPIIQPAKKPQPTDSKKLNSTTASLAKKGELASLWLSPNKPSSILPVEQPSPAPAADAR